MSILAIMLAMQAMFASAECKVEYRLMERADWYVLDASGIDDQPTQGVRYGEGDEA